MGAFIARFDSGRNRGLEEIGRENINCVSGLAAIIFGAVIVQEASFCTGRYRRNESLEAMRLIANPKIRIGLAALVLALSAPGEPSAPEKIYESGFSRVIYLGRDLCQALSPEKCDKVDPDAIALQPQDLPLIYPMTTTADSHLRRQVELSAGFIDLVNHLSHAKAIDKIQPGFFEQYVGNLARTCAADPAAPPPAIVDARFWTEDVINDQLGCFNQMIGMMMAINMSHHYLGHYAKYAPKLTDAGNKIQPINNFLTPAEWSVSVKAGALDALTCGLSTEGMGVLFTAVEKMPSRPEWTAYIAPPSADFPKLKKELARYEDDFFHDRLH